MAELGRWFEGRYVISRPLGEVTDAAAPPAAPPKKDGPANNS
jgi:hypothetical protein